MKIIEHACVLYIYNICPDELCCTVERPKLYNIVLNLNPARLSSSISCIVQAAGDKSEGSTVHAVLESLMDMEYQMPGSCEALVSKLLQRVGRS